MKRRALLATLGSGITLVSGCLGLVADAGDAPGDSSGANGTTTGGSGDGATGSATPGGESGGCPSFSEGADETVCFRSVDSSTPVFLEPSSRTFAVEPADAKPDAVSFTLHNRSGGTVEFNPAGWRLRRESDDGWTHVAPDATYLPRSELEAGATHTWTLSTATYPTANDDDRQHVAVDADLSPGRYAFQVTASSATTVIDHGGPDQTVTHEAERRTVVECIATFEYDEPTQMVIAPFADGTRG
ncbi:hypothetical protein [Halomicrococcus gelatinilyticus]|uniref:hypothetical protein n=1 Tax=Halomicrococcus gelatinilyticus TaxID=1702103 RepID=UPI002E167768